MTDIALDDLVAELENITLLDVRSAAEFSGEAGYPCDPRQGHIPGARHLPLDDLLAAPPAHVRELVGLPEGARVVTYCHSGQRSAFAAEILAAAGYDVANFKGSWHEWSRRDDLAAER